MLSSVLLFALLSASALSLVIGSRLQPRQGCQLEPNDPNCLLPLWNDATYNITFDDLTTSNDSHKKANITTTSLVFTNFTIAAPATSMSTAHLNTYDNSTHYLRLHANKTGFISVSPAAVNVTKNYFDFFKFQHLAFGCTLPSTIAGTGVPTNCTVILSAQCAGPDSQGTQDVKTYAWQEEFSVARGTKVAGLKWVDLGTYGKVYLCHNYTVKGMPLKVGGTMPVVWLDQMEVVEFTRSAIF